MAHSDARTPHAAKTGRNDARGKNLLSRLTEEDEFTEYTTIVGELCPFCRGRGEKFGTTPTLNS